MMGSAVEDLRHLIALRGLVPGLPRDRREVLEQVIADLEARIGPTVPKHRAAAILGISTQALDAWVRRGRIETRRPPGAARTGIDTAALVWTARQIPAGAARPGRHVDRARERAAFWRFNEAVTTAEMRAVSELPFARRVELIDAHNATMAELSGIRLRPSTAEGAGG